MYVFWLIWNMFLYNAFQSQFPEIYPWWSTVIIWPIGREFRSRCAPIILDIEIGDQRTGKICRRIIGTTTPLNNVILYYTFCCRHRFKFKCYKNLCPILILFPIKQKQLSPRIKISVPYTIQFWPSISGKCYIVNKRQFSSEINSPLLITKMWVNRIN